MQTIFRAISTSIRANPLPTWYSSSKAFSTYVSTYPRKEGSPLKLGQMTLEQYKTCLEWGAKEGWCVFKGDAEAFFEADPKGYLGGEINGEFVCSYTGIKYEDYCFLSLHMVKDGYRGKGYGTEIENYARDFYKDSASVCFEAREESIERFAKMGYKDYTAITLISKKAEGKMDKSLIDLRSVPIEELEAYDFSVFGYKRPNYLRALLKQPSNKGLAVMRNGRICGYALLRELLYQPGHGIKPMMPGYGIMPMMADDKEAAVKLLDGIQSCIPGEEVSLAIFHSNPIALEIMKVGNWTVADGYVRMYGGKKPKIDLNRLLVDDAY